jgi:flagellar biosynthesis/type III secretory pathway chaperone
MQVLSILEEEPYYRDFFTLSIIFNQIYITLLPELASKEEFKPVVTTQLKALSSSKLDNKEILDFIDRKKSLLEIVKELHYGRQSQQIEG